MDITLTVTECVPGVSAHLRRLDDYTMRFIYMCVYVFMYIIL